MRAAMNAILYLLDTGCPSRYLPRDDFPPRSTVYNILRKFERDGGLGGDLGRAAYGVARADGPGGQPLSRGSRQPIGQIDGKGGVILDQEVGYGAGKRVKGRKILALVDSEGLPMW